MASSSYANVPTYNILLLGETGVGKSTFINAFVNYTTFDSLTEAEREQLVFLVSTRFTVTDDDFKPRTIVVGESTNESEEVGASATQRPTDYMFNVGHANIRLIDTPGVGDTRGASQDNINFDKLLFHIGELKELHAICILLKPNESRITVMFEYCIKQLLSRLEKSASQNIMFMFTNSRGTNYRPGETLPSLVKLLQDTERKPPFVKIPLSKENIFCIDNEAFRSLLILKNGITLADAEKRSFVASWEHSSNECLRMITYIASLKPHKVQNTISINEARRLILHLSLPLADITENIQKNIDLLERKKEELRYHSDDVEKLKAKLSIPVMRLKVDAIDHPRTVCTSQKCCTVHMVNGEQQLHHEKPCCEPCILPYIPVSIIGAPELIFCQSMLSKSGNIAESLFNGIKNFVVSRFTGTDTISCKVCGCSYKFHKHVYYTTHSEMENIIDPAVESQLKSKESAKAAVEQIISDIEERSLEYQQEQKIVTASIAKFAHFLQNNAITPYNDAYEQFLEYIIDREKSYGTYADREKVKAFQKMLAAYQQEKRILDDALKSARQSDMSKTSYITAADVMTTVHELYNLRHCGSKIQELFTKQEEGRRRENVQRREVRVKYSRTSSVLNRLQNLF